ncbi:hypothetical protein A1Q1_05935 [Trichosporon asahii var. asahii CBS 2479]|uniref:V-type proton ATPase subunit G n=1 Tax=Trichosporon asahii var. asahii (strain ATCC 90039 / CBS 2479 / JCM 2466 / KCTC 7840 / NBRC 103889/ NCYC 2677 / UAMH 7654) TaxID=1186058 RepID=J5Q5P0_TRIAS|nr:hypothetical protein A1Q1_05935 [Trichosporon asahii var. asahii CBS 2479]EJT45598.1 hypothetical protein A1Q1_05935 [Trichosporon asahii var. asahii CBS 2479]
MAANSQGIQTLLEAEKEAAKVVQKARQYRVQKLKDARSEAAKEIEQYKAQKEADFKKFESDGSKCPAWTALSSAPAFSPEHWCSGEGDHHLRGLSLPRPLRTEEATLSPPLADPQHTSQTSTSQTTIDTDKDEQLKKLDAEVKKNGPDVVEKIVSRVLKVNPELHRNLKKVEA